MQSSHTIFLALGANVGNKKENIELAVELLQQKITITKRAPIYETKPWGYTQQGNFLNSAMKGTTNLNPEELLQFAKEVEQKIGRVKRFQNGPREIDIDILFYDAAVIHETDLQIPHPRLTERDFVLQPLDDIDPNFIHPILRKTVRELLTTLSGERYIIEKR